jgi:tetratricopeptide (TPR) repeat protein
MIRKSVLLILILISVQAFLPADVEEEFEKGKVIDKVVCKKNPDKSYSLYLPTAYTADREWPILYAFDPGARGKLPIDHFRAAAEKYNYIVVGSNDARNGPWEPVFQSMTAIWSDTNKRFSLDKKRIYVTGFSGGSRAASLFSRIIRQPVTGIIGCAAGLANPIIKPEQIHPSFYFGVVGITDFNYREMVNLHDQLTQNNVSNRLLIHAGGHDWPPEDICLRVIEWMEIIGMKKKVRPVDDNLIFEILKKEQAEARSLESSGELNSALSVYEDLAEIFGEWIDMSGLRSKIERIKQNKKYKAEIKLENRIKKGEVFNLRKFNQFYSQIEKNPVSIHELERYIQILKLDDLAKRAGKRKSGKEKAMAVRLLKSLEFETTSKGWTQFQGKKFEKAIYFYEVAAKAGNEDSLRKKYIYYNLACSYARMQNKKRAIKNIKLAVEHGFDEIEHLEKDEDLEYIRDREEFQKIISSLRPKKNDQKN